MFNVADVIGPYEITAILGQGGMSTVYQVKRRMSDTPIALKVLLPHLTKNTKHVGAFFEEAIRVEPLQHKHIIQIHHYGSVIATSGGDDGGRNGDADGNVHYIAMAYAQEGTLKHELAAEGETRKKLAWREALTVTKQIASALRYTHEHGLIHCDVKPSNILCLAKGQYVLSDYGIARRKDEAMSEVIGTPEYMSPEQCNGIPLDERSDIYSLGVVLYEMLAGRPPFTATEAMVVMYKHREQLPAPVSQYTAQIPQGVVALVNRTLAKQTADRFSDMSALIEAIDQQLNTVASGIPKWLFVGVTATVMLALGLGLGLGAWQVSNRQIAGGAVTVAPTVLVRAATVVEPDPTSIIIPGVGGIATTESNALGPPGPVSSPTLLPTRPVQTAPGGLATSTLAPLAPTPANTPIPLPTKSIAQTAIPLPQPAVIAAPTVALATTPRPLFVATVGPQPANPQPANPQPANPQPAPQPSQPQPSQPQPAAPSLPSCAALSLNEVPRPGRNCA